MTLLETKFYVAEPAAEHIPRPALLERMRAFPLDETCEYFRRRLGLAEGEQIQPIWQACEGWPALLQLAATGMERDSGARPHTGDLREGHREIAEHFADEVLAGLDSELRRRVRGLAALETCCRELCAAVLDEPVTADSLADIEAAHLPVVRLDAEGRWWRFHHLFAEFLRHRSSPGERALAHRRASRWFEDQGDIELAVSHAMGAGDGERAVQLLGSHGGALVECGRALALLRSIGRLGLPLEELETPLLDRVAWAAHLVHDDARCRRAIALLSRRESAGELDDRRAASLLALQAMLARSRDGDLPRAIELFGAARARLPVHRESPLSADAVSISFQLAIAQTFAGELVRAAEILSGLLLHVDPLRPLTMTEVGVVSTLAQVRASQGRLRTAEALCRRFLGAELRRSPAGEPRHALLHRTLGRLHVQRADWQRAEVELDRAEETSRRGGFEERPHSRPCGGPRWRAVGATPTPPMRPSRRWRRWPRRPAWRRCTMPGNERSSCTAGSTKGIWRVPGTCFGRSPGRPAT